MSTVIPRYADRFKCPHCGGLLERPEVTPTIPLSKTPFGIVKHGDIIERQVEGSGGKFDTGRIEKDALLPYYCFACNRSILASQTMPFRDPLPDSALYEPDDAPHSIRTATDPLTRRVASCQEA